MILPYPFFTGALFRWNATPQRRMDRYPYSLSAYCLTSISVSAVSQSRSICASEVERLASMNRPLGATKFRVVRALNCSSFLRTAQFLICIFCRLVVG